MTNEVQDIPKRVHELIDKQDIHDNLMRYCRGQDRKDLVLMKSTFWPEARDNHGAFVGNAHEFCEWSYSGHQTSQHFAIHHCSNVLIELSGHQAKCESAFLYVWIDPHKNETKLLGGRYNDRCEKRNGEWKVLQRQTIFDWANRLPGARDFEGIFGMPPTALKGDHFPNDLIYAES
ncbi:MAG: nuclear transport factor 2 family protein [Novosphingobium sp.]|nr:nuclear transport factor 2 family protein [Novosphingobium sp.]